MSKLVVKQIVLASRPKGLPSYENFRLEEAPMPDLPQGGLLLQVLAPTIRHQACPGARSRASEP
jgi:NADPH-dependent curcumin reductase CurA